MRSALGTGLFRAPERAKEFLRHFRTNFLIRWHARLRRVVERVRNPKNPEEENSSAGDLLGGESRHWSCSTRYGRRPEK
jgi:hypothetical protein